MKKLALVLVGVAAIALAGCGLWTDAKAASPPKSPADARQEEILRQDLGRPADPVLAGRYQMINARHFHAALPATSVQWEPKLGEIGQLAGGGFTLEGMFGHVGSKTAILLNTSLQDDPHAIDRALCHEMVHAFLFASGDSSTTHGPAFQTVLKRLVAEGAFEGIAASEDDRTHLKSWLDREAERLDAARPELDALVAGLEHDRVEYETALEDFNTRLAIAKAQGSPGPTDAEAQALNARRDAHNERVDAANTRARQDAADRAAFNQQVDRYNLMVAYPDGMDESTVAKRPPRK